MPANHPPTKKQLIRNIGAAQDRYSEAINALDPDDFLTSARPGEWTAKDIIAHVSAWEKLLCEWLEAAWSGLAPQTPVVCTEEDTEKMNAQIYAANRGRSLKDILDEVKPTFERTLALVNEYTSDENLGDRLPYGWACGDPLWLIIAYNTYLHFDAHAETLHDIAISRENKLG